MISPGFTTSGVGAEEGSEIVSWEASCAAYPEVALGAGVVEAASMLPYLAAVGILTGGASEPVYGEIADELLAHLRYPRGVTLPGLRHTAPITEGATVAAAIREMLVTFGALPPR